MSPLYILASLTCLTPAVDEPAPPELQVASEEHAEAAAVEEPAVDPAEPAPVERVVGTAEPAPVEEVADAVELPTVPPENDDWLKWTLTLSYELKNLSMGASFRYLDYLETHVATDFLLTALLMGFGLDDLNAIRITVAQSVAARLRIKPSVRLEPRFGARPEPGPYPHVIFGLGVWGLIELDSLAQVVRLGDAGVFLGGSTGMFGSFVFSAIDVTLAYRPLSVTAFYLDGEWDATGVQFGNPIIELSLTYTLPW